MQIAFRETEDGWQMYLRSCASVVAEEIRNTERTITVPDGCKAVLVTDQLAEQWTDWQAISARAPYTRVEAKATATDDPLVLDVRTRYA